MGCCNTLPVPPPLSSDKLQVQPTPQRSSKRGRLPTNKLMTITERYEILRALGSGTIGTLFHAKNLETCEIRTIREVNKSASYHSVEVFQEVKILKELDHQNIIKVYEAIETSRSYYIVLENIYGGSLADRFKKNNVEGVISKYIHDMFLGLAYLHSQGIVHCNLSQDYVVLSDTSETPVLKIIGFALAQRLSEKKTIDQKYLKYPWASPEMLRGEYSEKSDVWSAGIVLYSLLTQRQPFPKGSRSMVIDAISSASVDFYNSAFTGLSLDAQDLIKSMLKRDPDDRPTCEKILQHPWFGNSKRMLPITYNITKKLLGFKITSKVAKRIMVFIVEQLALVRKDYAILGYFRSLDLNEDGKASKDEVLNVFNQVGLNVTQDIDFIMENIDTKGTGKVRYLDLVLGLTNWSQEFKKKNLEKYFKAEGGFVDADWLKKEISGVEEKEWDEFLVKIPMDEGKIHIEGLKKILRLNISNLT
ncbi:hypothetical protein SteCoe_6389 [Stentor coeruleus]|uniref:Protein kinase domain-containing protein n=1 Tax=Stentor coeruleus TaxID=5963 RepID=A0A1R2CQ63_9CILI|nr:hypothetical protein SteCoe_6389 [Stentor coeruleus]